MSNQKRPLRQGVGPCSTKQLYQNWAKQKCQSQRPVLVAKHLDFFGPLRDDNIICCAWGSSTGPCTVQGEVWSVCPYLWRRSCRRLAPAWAIRWPKPPTAPRRRAGAWNLGRLRHWAWDGSSFQTMKPKPCFFVETCGNVESSWGVVCWSKQWLFVFWGGKRCSYTIRCSRTLTLDSLHVAWSLNVLLLAILMTHDSLSYGLEQKGLSCFRWQVKLLQLFKSGSVGWLRQWRANHSAKKNFHNLALVVFEASLLARLHEASSWWKI